MLKSDRLDARAFALAIVLVAGATLAGAWIAQSLGYAPCELCLKQRFAFYAGVPLGLAALLSAPVNPRAARVLFALIGVVFLANAVLAFYHSGVEFKFWPGPADCTGEYKSAASMDDFKAQLNAIRVVRCDVVSLRIFGFSLANANVLISGALAGLAALGLRRASPRA